MDSGVIVEVIEAHFMEADLQAAKQTLMDCLHAHHTEKHSNTTEYNHEDPLRDIAKKRTGANARQRTAEDIAELFHRPCHIDAAFKFAVTDHSKLPPVSPIEGRVDTGALLRALSDMRRSIDEIRNNVGGHGQQQNHTPQQQRTEHRRQTRTGSISQQTPAHQQPTVQPQNIQRAERAQQQRDQPTFAAVAAAQPHRPAQRPRLQGTAMVTALRVSRPVVRAVVTKLAPNETAENVREYLLSMQRFRATDIEVEMLQSRYPESYATAKVTFTGATEDDVYDASVWPERVWVRKYNPPQRRAQTAADRLTAPNR
jgi:hypothetical protein